MKIHNHPNSSYSSSRIGVYGASTTIILMFSITLRCLFTFYKATKHKRTDFLARYAIEQDNLAANDILSILVPKFVRSQLHGF
jgi:phospholipid-translocating ATPase